MSLLISTDDHRRASRRGQLRAAVLLTSMLGAACGVQPDTPSPEGRLGASVDAETSDPLDPPEEAFAAQLVDIEHLVEDVGVILPQGLDGWPEVSEPDVDELVSLAESVSSASVDTGTLLVRHDAHDNHFQVRVTNAEIGDEGVDRSDEDVLRESFQEMLRSLGAAPEEIEVTVGTIQAAGGRIGEPDTALLVAKKTYAERRVGGIPVSMDYAAATFTLEGELVGVHGRWRPIDYADSELSAEHLTMDDVIEQAEAHLASRGVVVSPTVYSVELSTFYRLVPSKRTSGRWALQLYGSAALRDSNGNGSGGEGKIPTYEFPVLGGAEIVDEPVHNAPGG